MRTSAIIKAAFLGQAKGFRDSRAAGTSPALMYPNCKENANIPTAAAAGGQRIASLVEPH
jgi:hypothetical protein